MLILPHIHTGIRHMDSQLAGKQRHMHTLTHTHRAVRMDINTRCYTKGSFSSPVKLCSWRRDTPGSGSEERLDRVRVKGETCQVQRRNMSGSEERPAMVRVRGET